MTDRKQYDFFAFFLVLQLLLLQTTGCKKEYSCEGCRLIIQKDSTSLPSPVKEFPECSLCKVSDDLSLSEWNFKTGNSFVCGTVGEAGAGIDPERKSFTFFGPSACSVDTGLVMTIYLSEALDQDKFHITTNKVAFFYYDNNAPNDIFISLPTALFSVSIESFIYSTGILTGTFNGTVFKPNGDTSFINDGNFKIKFR